MDERIILSKPQLLELENHIRLSRHVERYSLLRQYASGNVLDMACGCGYGSHLLATNPAVEHVTGVDADAEAIAHAQLHFQNPKITFLKSTIEDFTSKRKLDLVISVETIEHLKDISVFVECLRRNEVGKFIVTYPSKKTTHYNKFHYHDLSFNAVEKLFSEYRLERYFNWQHEFDVCFFRHS